MSIFEWLGENYFPGDFGKIKKRKFCRRNIPRYLVIVNALISIGLIAALYFLVFNSSMKPSLQNILLVSAGLAAYLLVSSFINPEPDYDNIGLFGTPINHPFKISDDVNRFLIILKAFIWPGFYIVRSAREIFVMFKNSGAEDYT